MRKDLRLIWLLLLLPMAVHAETLFDCAQEWCNYNGTIDKWECHYVGCPEKPDWINDTMLIKTTMVTVSNCTTQDILDDMYQLDDQRFERFDRRINTTLKVAETEESRLTCMSELNFCNQRIELLKQFYVNRSDFDRCNLLLSEANRKAESGDTTQLGSQNLILIGVAAVAAYFMFFKKKEELEPPEITPTPGDFGFNSSALESDVMLRKLRAENAELRRRASESKPPEPKPAPVTENQPQGDNTDVGD